LFRLEPLDAAALAQLAHRALADGERGLGSEPTTIDDDALGHLLDKSEGDARHLLTVLEVAHALTVQADRTTIALADAEAALALRSVRYGDDEHYDIISAFIKSIRGSDPDAGLYWLARMLEAGEDARFIARRLVILASEDIGLADPQALLTADAVARAVEHVGLPEVAINLAHAVIHLCLSPKSNSVVSALGAATAAVRDRRPGPVPMHLRDAHYRGAQMLGHGKGYVYPHDDPSGWVPQEHLPAEVAGERFYRPAGHGAEQRLVEQWRKRRGEETGDDGDG